MFEYLRIYAYQFEKFNFDKIIETLSKNSNSVPIQIDKKEPAY